MWDLLQIFGTFKHASLILRAPTYSYPSRLPLQVRLMSFGVMDRVGHSLLPILQWLGCLCFHGRNHIQAVVTLITGPLGVGYLHLCHFLQDSITVIAYRLCVLPASTPVPAIGIGSGGELDFSSFPLYRLYLIGNFGSNTLDLILWGLLLPIPFSSLKLALLKARPWEFLTPTPLGSDVRPSPSCLS